MDDIPNFSTWAKDSGRKVESTEEKLAALDEYSTFAKESALRSGVTDPEVYAGIDYGHFQTRAVLEKGDAADTGEEAFDEFLKSRRQQPDVVDTTTLDGDDLLSLGDKLGKAGRAEDAAVISEFNSLKSQGVDQYSTPRNDSIRARANKIIGEFKLDDIRSHGIDNGLIAAANIGGKLVTKQRFATPDIAKRAINSLNGPGVTTDLKADYLSRYNVNSALGPNASEAYNDGLGEFADKITPESAAWLTKLREQSSAHAMQLQGDLEFGDNPNDAPVTHKVFKGSDIGTLHFWNTADGRVKFGNKDIDAAVESMGLDESQAIDFVADIMRADFKGVNAEDTPGRVLTNGELAIHPAAALNDALFEKAMATPGASEVAKKAVRDRRDAMIDEKGIIATASLVDYGFTDELDKARAAGKSDKQFVKEYFNDPSNHSSLAAYTEALGAGVRDATWGLALGIGALMGNEWSRDQLIEQEKRRAADVELRELFGKNGNFSRLATGFLQTAPAVVADIALVFAGGLGAETAASRAGVKGLVKASLRRALSAETKGVVGNMLARRVGTLAAKEGVEAGVSNGVRLLTRDIHKAFNLGSVGTLAGTRVAGSNYATVYNNLVTGGMSPEDARERALTTAAISGVKTALITSAFSFLGKGGVESVLDPTKGLTMKQLKKQASAIFGSMPDDAAKAALGQVMRTNLKHKLKEIGAEAMHEGLEESIDEGIDYFITTIGSKQDVNLGHAVSQAFDAFILGGLLGGTATPAINSVRSGDVSISAAADTQAKLMQDTIAQLRRTGNTETADALEASLAAPVEGPPTSPDNSGAAAIDFRATGTGVSPVPQSQMYGELPTPRVLDMPGVPLRVDDTLASPTGNAVDPSLPLPAALRPKPEIDFANAGATNTLPSSKLYGDIQAPPQLTAPAVPLRVDDTLASPTGLVTPSLGLPAALEPRPVLRDSDAPLANPYGNGAFNPNEPNPQPVAEGEVAPPVEVPVQEVREGTQAPEGAGQDQGDLAGDGREGQANGLTPAEEIEAHLDRSVEKIGNLSRRNVKAARKELAVLEGKGFDTAPAEAALKKYEQVKAGRNKEQSEAAWTEFVATVNSLDNPLAGVDASFADLASGKMTAKEALALVEPKTPEAELQESVPDPVTVPEDIVVQETPAEDVPDVFAGKVLRADPRDIAYPEWRGDDDRVFEMFVEHALPLRQSQLRDAFSFRDHAYAKQAEAALRDRITARFPLIEHPGSPLVKGETSVGSGSTKGKATYPIGTVDGEVTALFTNHPLDAAEALNKGHRIVVPEAWHAQGLVNPNIKVGRLGDQLVVTRVKHPLGADVSRPGELTAFLSGNTERKATKTEATIAEASEDAVAFTAKLPRLPGEDKRLTKFYDEFNQMLNDQGGLLSDNKNRGLAEESAPVAYLRFLRETLLADEMVRTPERERLAKFKQLISGGRKLNGNKLADFADLLINRQGFGEFKKWKLSGADAVKQLAARNDAAFEQYIEHLVTTKAGRPERTAKQVVSYVNREVNVLADKQSRTEGSFDDVTEGGFAPEATLQEDEQVTRFAAEVSAQETLVDDAKARDTLTRILISMQPSYEKDIEAGALNGIELPQLAAAVAKIIDVSKLSANARRETTPQRLTEIDRAVDEFLATRIGRETFTKLSDQVQSRLLNSRGIVDEEVLIERLESNRAEAKQYGIESGKLTESLRAIAQSGPPHLATVARLLLPHSLALDATTSFIVVEDADGDYAGQIVGGRNKNLIMLNLAGSNGRGVADALIHEVLHAYLEHRLRNPRTKEDVAALKELNKLRRKFQYFLTDSAPLSRYEAYVTGSVSEFVTGLLTDRSLQAKVAMMEKGGLKGLLRKIANIFHRMLTGRDMQGDALSRVLAFAEGGSPAPFWNPGEVRTLRSENDWEDMMTMMHGDDWNAAPLDVTPRRQRTQRASGNRARVSVDEDPFDPNYQDRAEAADQADDELDQAYAEAVARRDNEEVAALLTEQGERTGGQLIETAEDGTLIPASVRNQTSAWNYNIEDPLANPLFDAVRRSAIGEEVEFPLGRAKGSSVRRVGSGSSKRSGQDAFMSVRENDEDYGYADTGNHIDDFVPLIDMLQSMEGVTATYDSEGNFNGTVERGDTTYEFTFRYDGTSLYLHSLMPVGGREESTANPIGLEVLSRIIMTLPDLGLSSFTTIGGKAVNMTGYRTWPAYGYTRVMTLQAGMDELIEGMPPAATSARIKALADNGGKFDLLKLTETKEGRKLWKDHGTATNLEFDATPGSRSLRRLAYWLNRIGQKHARSGGPDTDPTPRRDGRGRGRDTSLSAGPLEAPRSLSQRVRASLPKGVRMVVDPTFDGTMRAETDGTVRVNLERLAGVLDTLAPWAQDKVLVKLANEETAHVAGFSAIPDAEVEAMANELSDEDALHIAHEYVGTGNPEALAKAAGNKKMLVEERLRMTLQRATTGTTTEEDYAFYSANPGFLKRALRYMKAALSKLAINFKLRFDPATAVRIDRMREAMTQLGYGGTAPTMQLVVGDDASPGDVRRALTYAREMFGDDRVLNASVNVGVAFNKKSRLRQLFSHAGKNVDVFKAMEDDMTNARRAAESQAQRFEKQLNATLTAAYGKDKSAWPIDTVMAAFGSTDAALTAAQQDALDADLKARRKAAYDGYRQVLTQVRGLWKKGDVKAADAALAAGRTAYRQDLADAKADNDLLRNHNVNQNAIKRKADRLAELAKLPVPVQEVVENFREAIDNLSRELAMMPNGVNGQLATTLGRNLEIYLKRSYALFNEKGWRDMVKHDAEFQSLRDRATQFFFDEMVKAEADALGQRGGAMAGQPLAARIAHARTTVSADEARGKVFDFLDSYEQDGVSGFYGGHLLDKKNVTSLLQKKDLPEILRELMGDYSVGLTKDMTRNAVRTYTNLANMVSAQHYMNKVGAIAMKEKWLVTDAEHKADPELYSGYVRIGQTDMRDLKLRPFAGHYMQPEMYEVFTHVDPLRHPSTRLGFALTGMSMKAKTVWSAATTWRNHLGNVVVFGPAQGIPFGQSLFGGRQKKAFRLSRLNAGWGVSTEQDDAMLRELHELGVLDDNSNVNYIRELMQKTPEAITKAINARHPKWRKVAGGMLGKAVDGFRVVDKSLENLYQGIDNLHKIAVFDYELKVLRDANALESVKKTDDQLKREAADKVRDTQQTYSRTPEIVNFVRRDPVLGLIFAPFISFTAEVFRITGNTFRVGLAELRSGNPVMRKRGAMRLGAFTMLNAAMLTVPLIAKALTGLGDDEEYAVREALPEWMRNENLIMWKQDDGKVATLNVSNLNPFSLLGDVAVAFPQALRDPRNKLDVESTLRVIYSGMKPLIEPFTNEQILAGAIKDASVGEDNATGRRVWLESDSPADKLTKGLIHIVKATMPGSVDTAKRLGQGLEGYVTSTGREVTVGDELISILSGVKRHDQDLPTLYSSFVSRYNREAREAAGLRYDITRRSTTSPEEVTAAYDAYHARMVDLNREHHAVLRGLMNLGVTRNQLKGVASEQRLSEDDLNDLIRGRYRRYEPSKSTMDDLLIRAKRADTDPKARIAALRQAIRSKPALTSLYD